MTTSLVTGAARGVGAALARRLAAAGGSLALADNGPADALDTVAEHCRSAGAGVVTRNVDVRDEASIGAFVRETAETTGRLDWVYANAGVIHAPGDDGLSAKTARELMETNYFGAVNTLAPAVPIMTEQGSGGLVAIASISALVATHGSGAYSASKAALTMWTDSLRLTLTGTKVSVTNVILGFVDTPMTHGLEHAERLWIDADVAARQIIRAAERGTAIASVPSLRNAPWWALREMPYVLRASLLRRAYRSFN